MVRRFSILTALTLGLVSAPMASSAASLNAEILLQQFNGIVLGNINSSTSHFEGTGFVGGDINGANGFYANSRNRDGVSVGDVTGSLVVGGDINSRLTSGGRGDIVVGGEAIPQESAVERQIAAENVGTGDGGVPVSDVASVFTALSRDLATYADTAGAMANLADNNQKRLIAGEGNADDIAFLNLTDAQAERYFNGGGTVLTPDLSNASTLIVNVPGVSRTYTANNNSQDSRVLYNFFEATSLNIANGSVGQSILAPFADVTLGGSGMYGTLVANSLTQRSELRPFNTNTVFTGDLPPPTTTAVPLPAGGVLLLTGLGAVVVARRFRRAA